MKYLAFLFIFFSLSLRSEAQQLEQVFSITRIQKDYAYYNVQAGLWEQEVKNDPKNSNAWMNYYKAARMNNMFAGEKGSRYDMAVIAADLKKAIPNTFEYYYVSYKQEHNRDVAYPDLLKAFTIDPDRYDTWDGFITKAAFEEDYETMKSFFAKWELHRMYSSGLSNWNYNTLIGLEANAILITFGDNDTYPLWFLQLRKNIRTDVKVINASMIFDEAYRNKVFESINIPAFDKKLEEMNDYPAYRDALIAHILKETDRPAYIGISGPHSFRKQYKDNLYIVGLAFKYSKEDFDHVAVIRNNYENLFFKDYLKEDLSNDFSQSVVDYMNQQYIPCLTVLYKHYLLSGERRKAEELEKLLIRIGEKGKREGEIKDFLVKNKNRS